MIVGMAAPLESKEDFARRGDEIYDRTVLPHVRSEEGGKFVAIDIASEDYEIDADELAAADRLRARHPDAQIWFRQIGSRYARRFGGRQKPWAA